MSTNNPHLKNIDRAVYELPVLLKNLGDVDLTKPVTEDQGLMAEAAQAHAYNANEEVMYGIESIGQLMSTVGAIDDLNARDVTALGRLVRMLAVQAQHLQEVDLNMGAIVNARGRQQRDGNSARKGSPA